MFSKVISSAVLGVDAYRVDVEIHLSLGLQAFEIVGLGDGAVRESRVRIKSAIKNAELDFPRRRIAINLSPANIRKSGTAFDLPIALGILAASGLIPPEELVKSMVVGELSLDGTVRPIRGALPIALAARAAKMDVLFVPAENAAEAAVVQGINVVPIRHLTELVAVLLKQQKPSQIEGVDDTSSPPNDEDMSEVHGQTLAKRALEVAAAGGHNILLIGPPGAGKTMLARRLRGILPPPTPEECLEITKIHSVAGLLGPGDKLISRRPFRAPHHTASAVAIAGGGSFPRPGEITLAHTGVLFLDEILEFRKSVLETLRQPMEQRRICITRAMLSVDFPASFLLVASCNPCPCGYFGSAIECYCSVPAIQRYRGRLSGPLLDRIDLQVEVPRVNAADVSRHRSSESDSSEVIRQRVQQARFQQVRRFSGTPFRSNAEIPGRLLDRMATDDEATRYLVDAVDRLSLSVRTFDRMRRVARTIADLELSERVTVDHVAQAVRFRNLDRPVEDQIG